MERLEAGLDHIKAAPADEGRLEMIVTRPADRCERLVVEQCRLTAARRRRRRQLAAEVGRRRRGARSGHSAHVDEQHAVRISWPGTGGAGRWPAISCSSTSIWARTTWLPGQRLRIGDAVIEVTAEPHTGCSKFASRYGVDALKFVNMGEGARLKLRGIYARVVEEGERSAPGIRFKKV